MKLESSVTFVAIAILTFGMIFATPAIQIDKVFAKPIVGGDSNFKVNGDQVSNGEKLKFFEDTLGSIFGGGEQNSGPFSSSQPSSTSSDTPSSSTDLKDAPCKQSEGTGTKDYYCFGTHHHCEEGVSPGCVPEGGRT
jgi:hypothetical protein